MMAPRPTLLIYNAEDNCCFRAELVKPSVYEAIRPFFKLYGKEGDLGWHENTDPSTHNYQLDNRLAAYRFFGKHFGISLPEQEDHIAPEIKSYDDLVVSLPRDNLTILGLAQKLGLEIRHQPVPSDTSARTAWLTAERARLREVVRYKPAKVEQVWGVATTKDKGLQSVSDLFQMNDGLRAEGVWIRAIKQSSDSAPADIVLNDDGREAAQLVSIANWAKHRARVPKLRVETVGIRTQMVALVAASIDPGLFSEIVIRDGMRSLSCALDLPIKFSQAPELFCLDFYKDFGIDQLMAVAAPAKISMKSYVEIAHK